MNIFRQRRGRFNLCLFLYMYIVKLHTWLSASSPKLPIEYAVDMTCVDRILFCSAHVTFITSLWQKGDAIRKWGELEGQHSTSTSSNSNSNCYKAIRRFLLGKDFQEKSKHPLLWLGCFVLRRFSGIASGLSRCMQPLNLFDCGRSHSCHQGIIDLDDVIKMPCVPGKVESQLGQQP